MIVSALIPYHCKIDSGVWIDNIHFSICMVSMQDGNGARLHHVFGIVSLLEMLWKGKRM